MEREDCFLIVFLHPFYNMQDQMNFKARLEGGGGRWTTATPRDVHYCSVL